MGASFFHFFFRGTSFTNFFASSFFSYSWISWYFFSILNSLKFPMESIDKFIKNIFRVNRACFNVTIGWDQMWGCWKVQRISTGTQIYYVMIHLFFGNQFFFLIFLNSLVTNQLVLYFWSLFSSICSIFLSWISRIWFFESTWLEEPASFHEN